MKAKSRLETVQRRNPAVFELAKLVSPASQIDSALLRSARLSIMTPPTSPDMEGDLWFSPLVQMANVRGFTFFPEVANMLRSELAAVPAKFDDATRLIEELHQDHPLPIRLEEEIVKLTFGYERKDSIEERLLRLLATLRQPDRKGLARWVMSMASRWPSQLQSPLLARLELLAKAQILGVDFVQEKGEELSEEEFRDVLTVVGRIPVGVRMRERHLEFFEPPTPGSQLISVPATKTRSITLDSEDDEKGRELAWTGAAGTGTSIEVLPVTIQTLAGDRYALRSRRLVTEEWNGRISGGLVAITDRKMETAFPGLLVDERHVLTTNALLPIGEVGADDEHTSPTPDLLVRFPLLEQDEPIPARVHSRINGREQFPLDRLLLLELRADLPDGAEPATWQAAPISVGDSLLGVGFPIESGEERWELFNVSKQSNQEVRLAPAANFSGETLIHWTGSPLFFYDTGALVGICWKAPSETEPEIELLPPTLLDRFLAVHSSKDTEQPKQVRVLRIFISSAGDVQEERDVLEEVVRDINNSDGEERGVQLKTFRWEKDVIPRIGPPAQKVIDDQMPDCDIYLGILSARFGTPTGGFGSGTEQEFRSALKSWGKQGEPWILFYFNDDPPPVAEMSTEQVEQFLKVRRFRDELQKLGFTVSYKGGPQGFGLQAAKYLRHVLRKLTELPSKLEVPEAYKQWLLSRCTDVGLLGLRPKQVQTVRLNNVYVPLTTWRSDDEGGGEVRKRVSQRTLSEKPQLLLDLLGRRSLYVSGAPGSGKSTFCRWVSWLACAGGMPGQEMEVPEEYSESWPAALHARLPVLVPLRQMWVFLPYAAGAAQLIEGLEGWLKNIRPPEMDGNLLQAHLEKGSALLILDGVDEVPLSRSQGSELWAPRSLLLSGLAEAIPAWEKAGNRLLVTSRPYGLTSAETARLGLQHAPIQNLSSEQQSILARRWFHIQSVPGQESESSAQVMLSDLRNRPGLDALADNPLLLTATCIIYGEGKLLHQDNFDFYSRIVDTVLYSRFPKDRSVVDPIRYRLCVVAHGMHTGEGLGEERQTPKAETTVEEIDRLIRHYQERTPYTEKGYRGAVEAREQLLSSSGLLLPHGEGRAGFYHLSLQEHLAAMRLLVLHEGDLLSVFQRRSQRPEWRNTLSLLFGADLASRNSPRRSVELLDRIIQTASEDQIGLQAVAADCLDKLLARGIGLPQEAEENFRRLCLSAIQSEAPLQERHLLGLTLGRLGDPRVVVDLRDPRAYVEVPAGDYRVGKEETRAYPLKESFLLCRYPVTNSQFELFMAEGNYQEQRHWSNRGRVWLKRSGVQEPRFWRDARWNAPNQPVGGVCYWEAEAFANWAGGRLPTEWEWEAAARGKQACIYPWCGEWRDGICNTEECSLWMTSAVGAFPRSASPSGLQDLCGNVWEWCRPDDEEKETKKAGIDVSRPIRGGSWKSDRNIALSAIRGEKDAGNRLNDLGFRVSLLVGPRTRKR